MIRFPGLANSEREVYLQKSLLESALRINPYEGVKEAIFLHSLIGKN